VINRPASRMEPRSLLADHTHDSRDFGWLMPQHAVLPLVAFTCAAFGRLLQRVEIPFVWFGGTALPLLIAWGLFGPLISGWQFPWLVWLGLTVSCKALREIVRLFERVFIEDFA